MCLYLAKLRNTLALPPKSISVDDNDAISRILLSFYKILIGSQALNFQFKPIEGAVISECKAIISVTGWNKKIEIKVGQTT